MTELRPKVGHSLIWNVNLAIINNQSWTGLGPIPLNALFSIFYKFAKVRIPEFSTTIVQLFDSK